MSTERLFTCSRCGSNGFVRVESITIDSAGKAIEASDGGLKCSNCLQFYMIGDDKTIVPMDPGRAAAVQGGNRVRSSVSSDARGVRQESGGDPRKF